MSDILSIGLPELKSRYETASLDSKVMFGDYQIVMLDALTYLRTHLPKEGEYLSAADTSTIREHLKRRSAEIWNFVEKGGLVLYFPHSNLEYRGYQNNTVKNLAFEDLLFEKSLTASVGSKIQITNKVHDAIHTFLDKVLDQLIYRVILPNYAEYEACLESRDQSQIVGNYKLHKSGGALVVLPSLSLADEEDLATFVAAAQALRTQLSPNSSASKSENKSVAATKIQIEAPGKGNDATGLLPDWHLDYLLPEQKVIADSVASLKDEISRLVDQLNNKSAEAKKLDIFKVLVTGHGQPLQKIVANVLQKIGFEIEEAPEGQPGLIAHYQDQVVLIDVKGIERKGAVEADAARLERWAAKYYEENDQPAKALLIVNGYSALPLSQRTEDVFPHKMLRYSTQRDHSLISGLQLLCLYADALKNPSKQASYVEKLIGNVGVYPDYTGNSWTKVISQVVAG